jgi:hypothetical protein
MLLKSTSYDERLEKNWNWCKKYFDRKSKEFHLKGWTIGMDHAKLRLGRCDQGKKKITISKHLLRGPTCDEQKMRNTILHEMAHAIVGASHGHNEVWKTMARKIGCDGKVCGSLDLPDAKYVMECPKKCFVQPYYRLPKIDGKVCLKCKSTPIIKILK